MTSFAVALEPRPEPRLAALAAAVHLLAGASPWLARCPPDVATALSLLALAGLCATLARIPGPQSSLSAVVLDRSGCRARFGRDGEFSAATMGRGSRAYGAVVYLEIRRPGRRAAWLLTRAALPAADFRRLKARIRLSC